MNRDAFKLFQWFSTSTVELKSLLFFFFLFPFSFSFCRFGSWVVHLEVLNQILRWKNNNMGKKENDIFLGVYFLLLNKVLKSIWVDMWKNCACLLPPRMDIQCSLQLRLSWWEALPKVFLIHHTEDDAEPAMCTIVTPPVKWAYSTFCVIYFMFAIFCASLSEVIHWNIFAFF